MAAASGLGLGGALETGGDVEVASKYCGCRFATPTVRRALAGIVTIDSGHGR
jgi:hypothetical protein